MCERYVGGPSLLPHLPHRRNPRRIHLLLRQPRGPLVLVLRLRLIDQRIDLRLVDVDVLAHGALVVGVGFGVLADTCMHTCRR